MNKKSAHKIFYSLIVVHLLVSCSYFNQEQPIDTVAQLEDSYLSRAEVLALLPADYTKADSALIVQKYIDTWATNRMLMRNAFQNIDSDKQASLNLLIERYKTELYSQAYLQELIKQSLDTTIPAQEIEDYFEAHRDEFILNEDLIKFRYVHVDQTYSQLENISKWFDKGSKESLKNLDSLSLSFKSSLLNDTVWVKKNILLERVAPITAANESQYVIPGQTWRLQDSLDVYLVRFKDVLRRGEPAPLSYVNPTIKQILLNQRKLAFIKKIEKDLLNDAIESNKLKIYP